MQPRRLSAGYDQEKPRDDNYIKFTPSTSPAGQQDFLTVIHATGSAGGGGSSSSHILATLTHTPCVGGDWLGARVVTGGRTYEAMFAPLGAAPGGKVRIGGAAGGWQTLPTTIVR